LTLALTLPMAILLATVSTVLAGPPAAGASGAPTSGNGSGSSSVSALQARAAEIAATIDSEAVQIHQLAERYLAEKTALAQIELRQARTVVQVALARSQLTTARSTLAQAAISQYVNSGSSTSDTDFLTSDAAGTSAASEGQAYLAVVAGRFQLDEASLQVATTRFASVLTALAGSRRETARALSATTDARRQVVGEISTEQTVLATVKGRMAQLVAEAEAEQAAAKQAAAAQAAAAQAAAAQAAAAQAAAAQAAAAQAAAAQAAAAQAAAARRRAHTAPRPSVPQGLPLPGGPASVGTGFAIPKPTLAADFAALRMCESSDDYAANTGNGYYGAYQFALSTWEGLGFSGLPSAAPAAVQNKAAYELWQQDGWAPWPACSAMLGL
jgi:hypothetical protein